MSRRIKWIAIVLAGVVAILLIVSAVHVYVTSTRLNARLEKLRADGDPICIADLAPSPIPAGQNAAVLVRRIRDDIAAFNEEVKEYYESENYETGRPDESQLKTIEAAFDAYPDILPTIQEAVALEGYNLGLDYSVPPEHFMTAMIDQTGQERAIARILSLHATVLRSRGQWDEAAATAVPMLRWAECVDKHPRMLMNYPIPLVIRWMAVDVANRALRGGPVSAETRRRLDTELARADSLSGYVAALKAERAYGIDSFNSFPFPLQWSRKTLVYLDTLAEEIRLAPEPYSVYTSSPKRAANARSAGVLVKLVLPALESARAATERNLATLRSMRVYLALLGRDDPDAPPPDDLIELGLPKDATTDPFTGKPLLVKKLPEGWKVYSVGGNLVDEGGKLNNASDVGVGPVTEGAEGE